MTYFIGYYNKPWAAENKDFVVLASTKAAAVAEFIERSYNEGYKRSGLSTKAVTVEKKEISSYRYAE